MIIFRKTLAQEITSHTLYSYLYMNKLVFQKNTTIARHCKTFVPLRILDIFSADVKNNAVSMLMVFQ